MSKSQALIVGGTTGMGKATIPLANVGTESYYHITSTSNISAT